MAEVAPGLKTVFATIRPRKLLRAVFEFGGRKLDFDWNQEDDFESKLFEAMNQYGAKGNRKDLKKWASWCSDFYDMVSICRQYKSKNKFRVLWSRLTQRGLVGQFLTDMQDGNPSAQKLVAWIFVNDHDALWAQLLKDAVVEDLSGSGGRRFYVPHVETLPEEKSAKKYYINSFLEYMSKEQTLIDHLHVERNDLGDIDRYVMHVNPFPRNVEQFEDDKLQLMLDKNAEGFSIVFYPMEDYFKVKCSFSKKQTDKIADLFAKYILGTEIRDKPEERYPINSLNPNYKIDFEMPINDPNIVACRASGLKVAIDNPITGTCEEIEHKCNSGNIFACAASSLKEYDIKWRTILKLSFQIEIVEQASYLIQKDFFASEDKDIVTHKYEVHFTEGRFSCNCHNPTELKIITDYFAANGLRNIAGQNALKKVIRK